MANTRTPAGALACHTSPILYSSAKTFSHFPSRQAMAWVKRRARRLQAAFAVSRREALSAALGDWAAFQPASAL